MSLGLGLGVIKRSVPSLPVSHNVKLYGAVGDGTTDDTVAIKAAISASVAGEEIYFPAGLYKISSTLSIQKNIRLRGTGNLSKIMLVSDTAGLRVIEYINYTISTPTVTVDIPQNATFVTLSSTAGLSAGDVIRINTALNAYPDSTVYKAGTVKRIASIDGNIVHLTSPVEYALPVASISSVSTSRGYVGLYIRDLQVTVQPDKKQYGIRVNNPVDFTVSNVTIVGNTAPMVWDATASNNTVDNQAGLQLLQCFDGVVSNVSSSGFGRRSDGEGYGIHIAGHNVTVSNSYTSMCKHGIVTSENNYRCGGVTYDGNVSDKDYVAYDIHDNARDCVIKNNSVVQLDYHVGGTLAWLRSPSVTMFGNYAHVSDIYAKSYGIMVDNHAGSDVILYNNDILAGWYGLSFGNLVTGTIPSDFDIHSNSLAADVPIYYGAFSPALAWGLHDNVLIETR